MQNRLRLIRAQQGERGISQTMLARRARIHHQRYWKIENDLADPRDEEIAALARVLETAAEELFPPLADREIAVSQ